jgi:hypothetical protein
VRSIQQVHVPSWSIGNHCRDRLPRRSLQEDKETCLIRFGRAKEIDEEAVRAGDALG